MSRPEYKQMNETWLTLDSDSQKHHKNKHKNSGYDDTYSEDQYKKSKQMHHNNKETIQDISKQKGHDKVHDSSEKIKSVAIVPKTRVKFSMISENLLRDTNLEEPVSIP